MRDLSKENSDKNMRGRLNHTKDVLMSITIRPFIASLKYLALIILYLFVAILTSILVFGKLVRTRPGLSVIRTKSDKDKQTSGKCAEHSNASWTDYSVTGNSPIRYGFTEILSTDNPEAYQPHQPRGKFYVTSFGDIMPSLN